MRALELLIAFEKLVVGFSSLKIITFRACLLLLGMNFRCFLSDTAAHL